MTAGVARPPVVAQWDEMVRLHARVRAELGGRQWGAHGDVGPYLRVAEDLVARALGRGDVVGASWARLAVDVTLTARQLAATVAVPPAVDALAALAWAAYAWCADVDGEVADRLASCRSALGEPGGAPAADPHEDPGVRS